MNEKIDIAFCFDRKMLNPACVAIASLLDFKGNEAIHYDITCICDIGMEEEQVLCNIVSKRDKESNISFYPAPRQFKEAYEVRDITASTYSRLLLHRILPQKNKIIYVDADVIFQGSLQEMWEIDLGEFYLAGVKGANNFSKKWEERREDRHIGELEGQRGKYINAGVVLMNLEAFRLWNPDELWFRMSQDDYEYQDQDILNITCKEKILYLDIKFNVQAHLEKRDFKCFIEENLYTKQQCEIAWNNPVIIHYTGAKPWKNRGVHRGKLWWLYVDGQEDLIKLFNKADIPNRKTTGIIGKINRHLPW